MQPMIRLRRGGKRHQASFRIVVAQKSEAADGDYLESLGTYNPRTQPSLIKLDASRALHWLHQGALPSDTVRSILRRTGVWEKYHQGAGPDDLAPDEKTVLQGPEGMKATTSQRSAQAAAAAEEAEAEAAEAEAAEEAEAEEAAAQAADEPEAEAEAAPAEDDGDEVEAEAEADAEDQAEEADEIAAEAEADEAEADEEETDEEEETDDEESEKES